MIPRVRAIACLKPLVFLRKLVARTLPRSRTKNKKHIPRGRAGRAAALQPFQLSACTFARRNMFVPPPPGSNGISNAKERIDGGVTKIPGGQGVKGLVVVGCGVRWNGVVCCVCCVWVWLSCVMCV